MKDGPQDGPPGRPNWAQSRLIRLTQGGSKGAQASIIGFVMAGPIIGGFLLGAWLDQKLGTSFWTIVLGLLGVFSGFREMLTMLKRLSPTPGQRTPPPGREQTTLKTSPARTSRASEVPGAAPEEASPKPRLFSVPPPPLPGSPQSKSPSEPPAAPETTEEIIKRLLDEDEDNGSEDGDAAQGGAGRREK